MNKGTRRLKTILPVALFIFIIAGYARYRTWPERLVEEGRLAIDEGRAAEVETILGPAISIKRTRAAATFLIAEASVAINQPKQAVGYLEALQPDADQEPMTAYWKGRVLLAAGQYVQAIRWLGLASSADARWVDARKWLAVACYESGERRRCLQILEEVVAIDPGQTDVWYAMALVHQENLDLEEAFTAFEKAIARPPWNYRALLEGARTALELGRNEQCEEWLGRLPANYQVARQSVVRAGLLIRLNRMEEARRLLDEAIRQSSDSPADLLAHSALLNQAGGNLAEAESQFSQALAKQPQNADWHYQRATVRRMLGKKEESKADFDMAASIRSRIMEMSRLNDEAEEAPLDARIRLKIGQIAESLEMKELATGWYKAALACDVNLTEARSALQRLGPVTRTRVLFE